MLKKLSLILAAVSLCTNLGIVAPVSAQTETEETVILESNFQNCNPGIYSAENQKGGEDGETDLRNGVVMTDNDAALSTGYTIKNTETGEYDPISEADIVDDGGTKVLRLNTMFSEKEKYDINTTNKYPTLQTTADFPTSGKIRIDLEMKMTYPTKFWLYHSYSVKGGNYGIWRFEHANRSYSKIKVLDNQEVSSFLYEGGKNNDGYYTFTVIMDTVTSKMWFYKDGEFMTEATGAKPPVANWQLFLKPGALTDAGYAPTPTFNEEDPTKIESLAVYPQFMYIKSLKVTTHTDAVLESVTPVKDSTVVTPKEAVFNFSGDVTGVGSATVTAEGGRSVNVKSSLVFDGKTVTVPYDFEDNVTYTVKLEDVSIGLSLLDVETTFKAEPWKFSNIIKNPVVSSEVDNSIYLIKEDFEASDNDNIISEGNAGYGWNVDTKTNTTITELSDGTQALQLAPRSTFTIKHLGDTEEIALDNTTTLSYKVYLGANTTLFILSSNSGNIANWNRGAYKNGTETAEMSVGEWHDVKITLSEEEGTTIYVDGTELMNIDSDISLSDANYFTFKANGDNVLVDDLKVYLDKKQTYLKGMYPAYDATDISLSDAIELTYSGEISEASFANAKLIVKPNDTNEPVELTNGEGMTLNKDGNKVIITLDQPLEKNTGYAVELSGLKDETDSELETVRTRFSTVADPAWAVKDFAGTAEGTSKTYSIKVKNETNAKDARMAVAVYDENGNLKEVKFSAPAPESVNDWVELNATVNYTNDDTSKIFIWDSLENMNLINAIITD
jgi:hypothetical protein